MRTVRLGRRGIRKSINLCMSRTLHEPQQGRCGIHAEWLKIANMLSGKAE